MEKVRKFKRIKDSGYGRWATGEDYIEIGSGLIVDGFGYITCPEKTQKYWQEVYDDPESTLDLTKPLMTEKWGAGVLVTDNFEGVNFPILVMFKNVNDKDVVKAFMKDGYFDSHKLESERLTNVPETVVLYFNMYGIHVGVAYSSREAADTAALSSRTECIRVEYKKGQFDD